MKEIYWTEKALVKVLDRFAKATSNEELSDTFFNHKTETEDQIERLEQVFEFCDVKPTTKRNMAVEGLIEDAVAVITDFEVGEVRDAGLIMAAQKIEHYEISCYSSLCNLAEVLGFEECVDLLGENLEEERAIEETLSEVAQLVYENVMDTY